MDKSAVTHKLLIMEFQMRYGQPGGKASCSHTEMECDESDWEVKWHSHSFQYDMTYVKKKPCIRKK